jgi:hypothetical protein
MLGSPLHFLSYVNRRTNYSERILAAHELTILSYHLKKNLWLERDANAYLHDDLSTDLDIAMAVRRLGMPGRDTPDGILTRLTHTTIGKIVRQIETRAEPGLIDFGFLLLTLSETAANNISSAIDQIVRKTELDGECHDLTVPMVGEGTGLTVHATAEPREMARARLVAHCERRKYIHKARTWFGICVTSGDQPLRFGVSLDFPWEQSDKLDREIGQVERKAPIRLDNTGRNNKIGRNEPCPCGSGIKYKKCCGK